LDWLRFTLLDRLDKIGKSKIHLESLSPESIMVTTFSQEARKPSLFGRFLLAAVGVVVATSAVAAYYGITEDPLAAAAEPATAQGQRIAAPELVGGVDWLNTGKPLKLADLRGRIVLIDFWTLCCINCMHLLPDLAKLEAKYPGVLVVIGVHTPKFDNEKNSESIRKAILRYTIAHPVLNDANTVLWTRYGVNSWPSLFLIDPEGFVVWQSTGEDHYAALDKMIGNLVKIYDAKKMLKKDVLPFQLERFAEKGDGPLFFPGKILADEKSKRLFIADSTHQRIVITDLDGKKIDIAGAGTQGHQDGTFDAATFNDPQGMALDGETLYVADRRNHLIRELDLAKKTVKTVAGIPGVQNHSGWGAKGGLALKIGLNSPWDLLLHEKKLFIAMAGHHQIWTLDLDKKRVDPYAGTGEEQIKDGTLKSAAFAQPSGLASDGKTLWVADAETSSVRAMPINGTGNVKTIVGSGLFVFGDQSGKKGQVRLQHDLAVAYRDKMLYVADTYNSKIKTINPLDGTTKDFVGVKGMFNEPAGMSFGGDKLYVADTNSHRIQVIDMITQDVTTLRLQGVEAPTLPVGVEK
jgi:thiol-disulfide isomerase/thioredoxin